jgi:hypothetical protein
LNKTWLNREFATAARVSAITEAPQRDPPEGPLHTSLEESQHAPPGELLHTLPGK